MAYQIKFFFWKKDIFVKNSIKIMCEYSSKVPKLLQYHLMKNKNIFQSSY